MGRARKDIPTLRFGNKIYPEDLATENPWANYWYVDEDNGSDSANNGSSADKPVKTVEQGVANAGRNDVLFLRARAMSTGATDPVSYTENVVITADKDMLSIVGVPTGRVQGGLPQLKVGATTTQAVITVRAPGCRIANIGINGAGATGGGILLDDDASTKSAFGTTVENCHFKNCLGTDATGAETGGAIQWSTAGGAWQSSIVGNQFYKNVGDITLMGTSSSVPQDVLIANNDFLGTAAAVDCHIYFGGSGMANFMIRDNYFAGVLPALSGGNNVRYVSLIGTGLFANNYFAGSYTTTGFGIAKAAAIIPAAVGIAHNYSDAGLIVREA